MVLESKDFEYLVAYRVTTFGVRFINGHKFILIINWQFPIRYVRRERKARLLRRSLIQIPTLHYKVFVFF